MLEKKLLNEVERFKSINNNASNLNTQTLFEQEALPALPPAEDVPDASAAAPTPSPEDVEAPMDAPLPLPDEDVEEVDVTDLVKMTKDVKRELDLSKVEQGSVSQKMDDIFSKLSALENMNNEMQSILDKIDMLGQKVEDAKPPTPVEKLEMRSLDSYPFNQKPNEFFNNKQLEMRQTGKNEYVLTKNDIENYSKDEISQSFNPTTYNA